MQLNAQDFLRIVEKSGDLYFFDIETTSRDADYSPILCISIKPYGKKPFSFVAKSIGNDQKVVREASEALDKAACWVSYYGKGFDVPFLNARLLKWGLPRLPKKHHVDLYYTLAPLRVGRRSQAHFIEWLRLSEHKMTVSADVWASIGDDFTTNMTTMVKRCESDVKGLEQLYERTKHLIGEIQR